MGRVFFPTRIDHREVIRDDEIKVEIGTHSSQGCMAGNVFVGFLASLQQLLTMYQHAQLVLRKIECVAVGGNALLNIHIIARWY